VSCVWSGSGWILGNGSVSCSRVSAIGAMSSSSSFVFDFLNLALLPFFFAVGDAKSFRIPEFGEVVVVIVLLLSVGGRPPVELEAPGCGEPSSSSSLIIALPSRCDCIS